MTARTLPTQETLRRAYAECERLAREHYENFPVASLLMPREIRPHVAAVYAFARIADDFADEECYAGQDRIALLEDWHQRLLRCTEQEDDHPAFVALGHTIRTRRLPLHPFEHLLTAFRMDVIKRSYDSFEDLLGYCRYSANPVGQLVLLLNDHRDPRMHMMSDDICTALQLTNFWQDVAVDHAKGRCYLPREDLRRFGVDVGRVVASGATPAFRALMRFQVDRTREIFARGAGLPGMLGGRLGLEIRLTLAGGVKILDKIEENGFDVVGGRPKLATKDWIRLVAGSLTGAGTVGGPAAASPPQGASSGAEKGNRASPRSGPGTAEGSDDQAPGTESGEEPGTGSIRGAFTGSRPAKTAGVPDIATSPDGVLRGDAGSDRELVHSITTKSRSNFTYAFLFLPREQREALESLYAFCRVVDDAVDDSEDPAVARRALERWRRELAACFGGREPSDPVTRALARQVESFNMSREPLEEVIRGVEMDLEGARYETWEDLQVYCRRVASAVGHSCLEIFGSRGEASRRYATTLGLAFQLTNILRDLRADARRGRCYLPLEEMRRAGYTLEEAAAGRRSPAFFDLMRHQCDRAADLFHRAGEELPPREENRLMAAEIMRAIYRGILDKIIARPQAVLEGRVRLGTGRRIALAAAAYARTRWSS